MNKNYHLLNIKTNKLVDSLFVWNYKTHFKSKGIEFADFREYVEGDDVRSIDFLTSAREWKTVVKLFDEERELNMYFLIDEASQFDFEINNISKRNTLEEVMYMLGLSAIKWWDKIWAYIFSWNKKEFIYAKKWKLSLLNILKKVNQFKNITLKSNILNHKSKLSYFNSLKVNKSLIFLCTSQFDLDEKQLKILALKHDVIVINIFISFENTLESHGIQWLKNKSNRIVIDIDDAKKRKEYIELRKKKIIDFKRKVRRYWADYLYIDENINIYSAFLKLMKNRS